MISRREFLGTAAAARAVRRPPNIVLILADDLGYGDLSCYGGPVPTPNLDRLAAGGVRFTQAYAAAPICSPSRAGLMTGQFPARHLIFSYLDSRAKQRELGMRDFLDPAVPVLPRALKNAGYATGHCGKWHLGGGRDVDDAPLPTQYGFDESLTSFEGLGDRVLPPGRLSDMSAKLGRGEITRAPKHKLTEIFVDRALAFAEKNRSVPFFLNLWPDDVHDPYEPDPAVLGRFQRFASNKYQQQFAAVLDEFDRQIGRLTSTLDRMGLARDTLFVFTGDNGPTAWPFYYREGFQPPGSTAGLRGRKWSLYEGGIREPLIARWSGRIPAGRTDRRSVISSLDLFPTLCRLAGAPPPAADLDGEDVSEALLGRGHLRRKDLLWEYGRSPQGYAYPGLESDRSPNLAMRRGRWKALVNADGSRFELYDLAQSEQELVNVSERAPGVADAMKNRMLAWRQSLPVLA